ncbi:MAG: sugar phosphate isomerase/epimerase [Verrucomicrobiales bacterium]|nr:sugar phosphate isomerase/epimerase [Verrucomicrobiales bacterium]
MRTTARRSFLGQLSGAGLVAMAMAPAAASLRTSAAVPRGWKTAIGLNGFHSGAAKYHKNYPLWEVLDFAAREGFDGVELVSDWPQGGYPPGNDRDRVHALRRLYDGYGLRIFSIQLGADGAFAPDASARAAWIAMVRDRLQLARQLGCACVGLWPGGGLRGQTLEEAMSRLTASFREVATMAADAGILAAVEIEPPFEFRTEEHLHRILDGTNHPNLKAIFDPSHFDLMNGSTGRPHEMLQRLGVERIGYLHLTDTDGTLRDGGTSKHLPCGDGHAQVATALKVLREGGFKGWCMIDAWEVPDAYDACRKGLRMIRGAR